MFDARAYLEVFDMQYGGFGFSQCNPLVKIVYEAKLHCCEAGFDNLCKSLCHTIYELKTYDLETETKDGIEQVRAANKREKHLDKAIFHLQEAAKLLGVRENLFYMQTDTAIAEKQLRSETDAEKYPREYPPEIEGETAAEFYSRRKLTAYLYYGYENFPARVYQTQEQPYLAKQGKASYKSIAVKKIWECIPTKLREVTHDRTPYADVAGILNYCGIEVDSVYVRKIVIP